MSHIRYKYNGGRGASSRGLVRKIGFTDYFLVGDATQAGDSEINHQFVDFTPTAYLRSFQKDLRMMKASAKRSNAGCLGRRWCF